MMQDIILGRVWADHHQRIYGSDIEAPDDGAARTARTAPGSVPVAGKAIVLAVVASMASLGSSLATVATA